MLKIGKRGGLAACVALPVLGVAAALAGCSGGFNNNLVNGTTGVFFGADQPVGKGVARDFVDINNGIPQRLGIEFTSAALTGLPAVGPDVLATPYLAPLPADNHGNPFTNVVVAYASSHAATAEPAHFHCVFLIRNYQPTAPPFDLELAVPLVVEVPPDHVRVTDAANPIGVIVPGIGTLYDDPNVPVGLAPATSLGENIFYFGGHLNAISIGPTITQLASKATVTGEIKQPEFYPKDGFYPTQWRVFFDGVRGTHVVQMTNFVRARKFLPPT